MSGCVHNSIDSCGRFGCPMPREAVLMGSLLNVKGLAMRLRQKNGLTAEQCREYADHFLRFCKEAGIEPSILRGEP